MSLVAALAAACKSEPSLQTPSPEKPTPRAASARLRIDPAPPTGPLEPIVRQAMAGATSEGRSLVVYVGASWCEPCRRFHEAAERGELDAEFPKLVLLELDHDRDGERLASAGYVSTYIPLFALPGPDGRASGRQIEGSVKGDHAVANITPRLEELLKP